MDDRKRALFGLRWRDLLVLIGYVAMLLLALSRYQPWEDEGRAWLDARDSGLFDLVFHVLRYEGHPALWYLILWAPAHLHMPFVYINWIAAPFALAGIYVLLRYSPFPFYVRALLPFGFALGYQYAVVARSYVLFPLLGFLVAHQYRRQERRPVRMAIALALLANLSLHGTIVAISFAVAYTWKLFRESRRQPQPATWPRRQAWLGAGLFAASLLFVAVVVWPSRDLKPPVGPQVLHLFHKVVPASSHPAVRRPMLLPALYVQPGIAPAPQPQAGSQNGLPLRTRICKTFIYPIASFTPLALLFEALAVFFLYRRRETLLIAAPLLLGAFLVAVYLRPWHTGLIWVTLIMVLWAAWDDTPQPRPLTLQNGMAALLALVCLLQIAWTFGALRYQAHNSTYPAEAAANFLKSLPPGDRIDGYDHSFTVLPYFPGNPFHIEDFALDSVPTALADRPNVILLRPDSISSLQMTEFATAGYRQTHTFCGSPWFPNQPPEWSLCLAVLENPSP